MEAGDPRVALPLSQKRTTGTTDMKTLTNSTPERTAFTGGTVGVCEDQDMGFVGFEDTMGGFGGVRIGR